MYKRTFASSFKIPFSYCNLGYIFGYVTFYMYFILSLHIIRKKYLWRNHNRKCLRKEYTSVLWKISNDQTSSYLLIHFFTFSRRLKNIYVYIHITIWNGIKRFRPRQDFFFGKLLTLLWLNLHLRSAPRIKCYQRGRFGRVCGHYLGGPGP